MITLMAMKKRLLLALLATGACCAIAVSAINSDAHAQDTSKSCNSECLLRQIDMLDKKVVALERTVDVLMIDCQNRAEDHPPYRSWHFRRRLSHLYRPERRSRRICFVECKLLARHFVDYQVDATARADERRGTDCVSQTCRAAVRALIEIDPLPLRWH
jgi:hypothetical protein